MGFFYFWDSRDRKEGMIEMESGSQTDPMRSQPFDHRSLVYVFFGRNTNIFLKGAIISKILLHMWVTLVIKSHWLSGAAVLLATNNKLLFVFTNVYCAFSFLCFLVICSSSVLYFPWSIILLHVSCPIFGDGKPWLFDDPYWTVQALA